VGPRQVDPQDSRGQERQIRAAPDEAGQEHRIHAGIGPELHDDVLALAIDALETNAIRQQANARVLGQVLD
jgi:hypothetical protein